MKLLFVVDSLGEKRSANVNIACSLAKSISNTHEVQALTLVDDEMQISDEVLSLFTKIYTFADEKRISLSEKLREYNWEQSSLVNKVKHLASDWKFAVDFIDYYHLERHYLVHHYRVNIEKTCDKEHYDAVIVFCMPHYLAKALVCSKVSAKKCVYQMDPYTHHQQLSVKGEAKRKKKEKKIINNIDFLFTTPLIYDEFKKKDLDLDFEKIIPCEFPLIKPLDDDMVGKVHIDAESDVNFYYIGHFYKDIRNPHFLLELMKRLPANYILHIVGDNATEELVEYAKSNPERIVLHGWVSPDEAVRFIKKADVLININNVVTNQLASKLFDYINSGKPILNICKMYDCPSLNYVAKYEYALNLFEQDSISDETIKCVMSFVENCAGKSIPKDIISSTFFSNTTLFVSEQIINALTLRG